METWAIKEPVPCGVPGCRERAVLGVRIFGRLAHLCSHHVVIWWERAARG